MSKGLTGIPSLSYRGVNAGSPPNIKMYKRRPTVNDSENFIVGDLWLNITPTPATAREIWMLVALLHHTATWIRLYGGSGQAITNLIDDNGNIVVPDPATEGITVRGGDNINTDGSIPHVIIVNLDKSVWQPATTADQLHGVYGINAVPFLHAYGTGQTNTFLGGYAGNFTLIPANAKNNVALGRNALHALTGTVIGKATGNTACGFDSGKSITDGNLNTLCGESSGMTITSGEGNSFFGSSAGGVSVTTGSFNCFYGALIGSSYAGAESSNILIGAWTAGVVGESNTLHIGSATGAGIGELENDYISGIYKTAAGVAYLGTAPKMVAIGSDDKITSSPNIYMPVTTADTGQVIQVGNPILHTYGVHNTFAGALSGNFTLAPATGNIDRFNIGVGDYTLNSIAGTAGLEGSRNTACGYQALRQVTTGLGNCALGCSAGFELITGDNNVFIGHESNFAGTGFPGLTAGSYNVCLGYWTAKDYLTNESSNILIGSNVHGTAGDNNTLRIGVGTGAGLGELSFSFIAGIRGVTTTNADAVAVLIDSDGQLGTVSSSIRFKENVKDVPDVSNIISKLRPVEFNYKKHTAMDKQYGLIAEEVERVWPEMMVYDKDGLPETLKYQYLPIILLKEIQKLTKRIEELESK